MGEERLKFYETGKNPRKDIDVMGEVSRHLASGKKGTDDDKKVKDTKESSKEKKKKKKKRKSTDMEIDENSDDNADNKTKKKSSKKSSKRDSLDSTEQISPKKEK